MAGKALQLINGRARMTEVAALSTIYDETFVVSSGGLTANSLITLPSSGTYEDKDLLVYRNGKLLEKGQGYDNVGLAAPRTQIEILEPLDAGERIRFVADGDNDTIYDEVIAITGNPVAGTNFTLPGSQEYNDVELQVYLDGQRLEENIDFNYVGSIPRTQIQTVIDLFAGERLRFRIQP